MTRQLAAKRLERRGSNLPKNLYTGLGNYIFVRVEVEALLV